ncbi:MAG: hypothetical protein ABFD07_12710 [Methanobacterium sp.]
MKCEKCGYDVPCKGMLCTLCVKLNESSTTIDTWKALLTSNKIYWEQLLCSDGFYVLSWYANGEQGGINCEYFNPDGSLFTGEK